VKLEEAMATIIKLPQQKKSKSALHKEIKKYDNPGADDDMILELAQECKADFIVTGNTKDFMISRFKKTQIVTPAEYWDLYKPE
jgi:predicted nucleic acid-binding protein